MRIFALETNREKIKQKFLTSGEKEVLTVFYHGFSFFLASIRDVVLTAILIAIGITAANYGAPVNWTIAVLFVFWFFLVFFRLLRAYIDWAFDFIFVTTDKIVFVDQTSIIRRDINPINMESIVGVGTRTQFWNIFAFGIVSLQLKEGRGQGVIMRKYVPRAQDVAAKISALVTQYQRLDHLPENGA
ncbi:MAG: hypothetical protein WCG83_02540 [Candidatus Peregrinibacteria bacterium]